MGPVTCMTSLLSACLIVTLGQSAAVAVTQRATTPATTMAVRYASPSGVDSPTCLKTAPCGIVTAVNQSPPDNEVVIEPGTYGASSPLTTTIEPVSADVVIHGEADEPAPVIDTEAGAGGIVVADASTLSHVTINYSNDSGDAALVVESGSADHVTATTTVTGPAACGVDTTLTDSACIDTADEGYAVYGGVFGGHDNVVLRGVTAEAVGPDSIGFELESDADSYVVAATNSIFHGTYSDIYEDAVAAGGTDSITLRHCDYATAMNDGQGGETVDADATDISKPPTFVNVLADDFRELAGSPTVNAGAGDPSTDTDLDGHPRTIGSAPDIGAYELQQRPVLGKPKVTSKSQTKVRLTVAVSAEGAATKVYLVAVHGHTHAKSGTASIGAGEIGKIEHLTVHKLHGHTRYKIYAVATSSIGHTKSKTDTVTTRSH
jgi:hypothetical protein